MFESLNCKIIKTLFNETSEVIYSISEIEGFLFTGHSKGIIMIWEYNLGERVILFEN